MRKHKQLINSSTYFVLTCSIYNPFLLTNLLMTTTSNKMLWYPHTSMLTLWFVILQLYWGVFPAPLCIEMFNSILKHIPIMGLWLFELMHQFILLTQVTSKTGASSHPSSSSQFHWGQLLAFLSSSFFKYTKIKNISIFLHRLREYEVEVDQSTGRGPDVERVYFVIIEMARKFIHHPSLFSSQSKKTLNIKKFVLNDV